MPPRLEPETLTVSLPFYVEFTPPVKAKRHEVLHLPVSVFMLSHTSPSGAAGEKACYEVLVSVSGDPKATFTLALKPQKLGRLNVTAEAVAKLGSVMFLIVPEGVEAETNVGGVLCLSDGKQLLEEVMQVDLPKRIVEGSLRSYVSVSGNVLGKALKNLDNLVRLPTGCGEQNMVKVAPSVYVLKYLVAATDLREAETKKLAQTAINYIDSGYTNQLKYRHDNGSFSAFGQSHGIGSTWLTSFVFGVFGDEKTLANFQTVKVNFYPTLSTAFDFLRAVQREDGCFVEYGRVFHSDLHVADSTPKANLLKDLLLTSYVLSALFENTAYPASEVETTAYAYLALAESQPITQLLPVIRWLSAQQNEQGGFYSTQDTVVALRALAHAAGRLHLSTVASASSGHEESLVQAINESVCSYGSRIFLFKPHSAVAEDKESVGGTVYFVAYEKTVASWNSTLRLKTGCSCDILRDGKSVLAIWSGPHNFDLGEHTVVSFSSLQFMTRLEMKAPDSVRTKCRRIEGLQLLVHKLADAK
ncbi:unnamed protein product [Schistocephalus solidus]|uniref:A2M_recep domain-containing protein n=1 Tax=Schistocephalus solidus TaxID=70667 RepID=A0A183TMV8_SCHSO|nr:unnamed protein product [Schistocephalus solidus]